MLICKTCQIKDICGMPCHHICHSSGECENSSEEIASKWNCDYNKYLYLKTNMNLQHFIWTGIYMNDVVHASIQMKDNNIQFFRSSTDKRFIWISIKHRIYSCWKPIFYHQQYKQEVKGKNLFSKLSQAYLPYICL